MKKLLLLFVLIPAIVFASTDKNSNKAENNNETPTKESSKSNSEKDSIVKPPSVPLMLGAGLHFGTDGYGIHTRLWIHEIFGVHINLTNGYTNKDEHFELNLMLKPALDIQYKPYVFAGGGLHLIDITETDPDLYNEKIFSVTGGLGVEKFFGEDGRYSLSLEAAYTWGQAEYSVINHTKIGDTVQTITRGTETLSPFSAKFLYTHYFLPREKYPDSDNDGIKDYLDKCPNKAEDIDGFEDDDGCPDIDNDQDGILDSLDKCPLNPEDKDGFEDEDGCPDTDNDQDGVLDSLDKCPNEKETINGVDDSDGCPDVSDTDGDGITDDKDKCPDQAEDKDGFEDEDGCPDTDNDQDGILDSLDKCPNKKETVNGFEDEDGCPDEVRREMANIPTSQIKFITGSAKLVQGEHNEVLDKMVKLLLKHPTVNVRISGHTDDVGHPDKNKKLSHDRAVSVARYLSKHGVEKERLKVTGHGHERPIADNKSKEGRAQNRRVDIEPINED